MQKVLIMGGGLFIGRAIAERLWKEHQVTVLNRGSHPAPHGTEQLICDRDDAEAMRRLLAGRTFDWVIDVCGLHARQAEILTDSLDTSALRAVIFISSSAVYDVEHLTVPFRERDSLARNVYWEGYGIDKIAAEAAYRRAFADTAVKTVFLRPPYVYGERNYARRESFVFDHLLNDRPILIPASDCLLQFLYAPDLADIIAAVMERMEELPPHSVYNVGNAEPVTCRQWVQACANAVGVTPRIIPYAYQADGWNVRAFFPFHDYDNVLDVTAMKAFYPQETPFAEGLQHALTWFQAHRSEIDFNPQVTQNEQAILRDMLQ